MQSQYDDKLFKGATGKAFENARVLRQTQTSAEDLLWQELRSRKLMNLKFRRQHPLGNFIADFYCSEKSLVIEVDGSVHDKGLIKDYDQARTNELEKMNISVLRFTNTEVETNMLNVLNKIKEHASNTEKQSPL